MALISQSVDRHLDRHVVTDLQSLQHKQTIKCLSYFSLYTSLYRMSVVANRQKFSLIYGFIND